MLKCVCLKFKQQEKKSNKIIQAHTESPYESFNLTNNK